MVETMGDRIRMHRAKLHLSQTELGKLVKLSTNAISLLEANHVDPRASRIKALAKALGVSTDYLLGCQDEDVDSEYVPTMPEVA